MRVQTIKRLIPQPLRPVAKYFYRKFFKSNAFGFSSFGVSSKIQQLELRLDQFSNGLEFMESRIDRIYANMAQAIERGSSERKDLRTEDSNKFPCIVCDQGLASHRLIVSGVPYVECSHCKFTFVPGTGKDARFGRGRDSLSANAIQADSWPKQERIALFQVLLKLSVQASGRTSPRVLDFGSGTDCLQEKSELYGKIDFYDPFFSDPRLKTYEEIRKQLYDVILCVEVLEHATHPIIMMQQLKSLMSKDGLCVATSLLHDYKFNLVYLNPSASHISIHSKKSIGILASSCGLSHEILTLPGGDDQYYYHLFRHTEESV